MKLELTSVYVSVETAHKLKQHFKKNLVFELFFLSGISILSIMGIAFMSEKFSLFWYVVTFWFLISGIIYLRQQIISKSRLIIPLFKNVQLAYEIDNAKNIDEIERFLKKYVGYSFNEEIALFFIEKVDSLKSKVHPDVFNNGMTYSRTTLRYYTFKEKYNK